MLLHRDDGWAKLITLLGEICSYQTELAHINLDSFGTTNVRRLLTRLLQSVSGFWGLLNVQETNEQE